MISKTKRRRISFSKLNVERGPSDDTQGETEEGDHRIKVDVNEMLKISVSETRIQTSNKLVQ